MSTISQIISTMKLLTDGIPDINAFIYGDPSDINNYRDKQYPVLLVDQNVNIDGFNLKNYQRIYTFKLFFYDLYSRKQITQLDTSTKQRDIEQVAEIFLQAFRASYRAAGYPWKIENDENLTGFWAYYKNNDRLIQLMYILKIRATGECYFDTIGGNNTMVMDHNPQPS